MTWLDQLQRASFRGVPFQVHDITHQAGDTVVVREYPFQDLPTVFRMGESAEEIRFSAYVIGDDYIEQREALREVLSGEGVLVHPTAGSIRVYCAGRFTIKEAIVEEGGVARFDLAFIRADARRYPTGVSNTEGQAIAAAEVAYVTAQDQFAAAFSLDGVQAWVAERVGTHLLDSLAAVWAQIAPVVGQAGDFANQLIGAYQALLTHFDELVLSPLALAEGIAALFDLPDVFEDGEASRFQAAHAGLFDLAAVVARPDFQVLIVPEPGEGFVMFGTGDAAALGVDAPARAVLAQLNAASDQLIETLATAAYVRVTAAVELSDYDSAIGMRGAVLDQCSRLLVSASAQAASAALPGSAWHDAVADLQASALKDLQARSRDLVRLTTYTPQAWQPIWYVSYYLFGTVDYADEILALNPHIAHPLLVPPGQALRVRRRS